MKAKLPHSMSLRRPRRTVALLALWVLLTAVAAIALAQGQGQSRAEIESRFQLRNDMAARFVETYVGDSFAQERRVANSTLSDASFAPGAFDRAVTLIGAEAAVLLDAQGDALDAAPRDPKVIGTNLSDTYAHLQSAVEGEPAVSNVVPSAVEGKPIVAFAVPFDSARGTRVFSGAYDVRSTPLASYLERAAVLAPNRVYLTDAAGVVFATNDPTIDAGSTLPSDWVPADEQTGDDLVTGHLSSGDYVVSGDVEGTPWRLVMKGEATYLYEAASGIGRVVPWLILIGFAAGGLLSVLLVERLARRRERLAELNAQLALLVNVDALTGLPNRRSVDHELDQAMAMAKRYDHPLSVLMIDIDSFKSINDEFGHAAGDAALRYVATQLRSSLRTVDVPGRWAGDEFLVVLPENDVRGAEIVAGRLNEAVAANPLSIGDESKEVTLSIGVAQWDGELAKDLIHRADEALYVAKAEGRDRFSTSPGAVVA